MSSSKIHTLHDLAGILEEERRKGKTIVLCHGVFDLMHIGHVRHLQEARKLGDVLVVTLTRDRWVTKGPHRPAFTDQLRAEVLAALECVDYVALNEWPSAVETIQLLRPDFYVKGMVKESGPRDHTDIILKEEEAVLAVGGRIHFTDEETYSATTLINRYMDVFSPEVRIYLDRFRQSFPEEAVLKYLHGIRGLKILTIGETIIDEYNFCNVLNKANKDPILAAQFLYGERYLGGIQAINNHLAGFCDHVGCLTSLGSRDSEEEFIRTHLAPTVDLHYFPKADAPTIIKRRYLEKYLNIKLIEIDVINDDPLTPPDEETFCDMISELAPQCDLVIAADYGHGLMTDRAISVLCEKARFLALNVQVNANNYGFNLLSRYPRADFVTIDEPEASLEMRRKQVDIDTVTTLLANQLNCRSFLLTRGQKGTFGYDKATGLSVTPVFSVSPVDRIGSGDACLALTAPCAALGAPTEMLGFVANLAGAMACAIMGNKTHIDAPSYFRGVSSLLK